MDEHLRSCSNDRLDRRGVTSTTKEGPGRRARLLVSYIRVSDISKTVLLPWEHQDCTDSTIRKQLTQQRDVPPPPPLPTSIMPHITTPVDTLDNPCDNLEPHFTTAVYHSLRCNTQPSRPKLKCWHTLRPTTSYAAAHICSLTHTTCTHKQKHAPNAMNSVCHPAFGCASLSLLAALIDDMCSCGKYRQRRTDRHTHN